MRKALGRHIKLFPHSARAKLHGSRPSGNSFRELIQRREKIRDCLNQDLLTNKGISSTVDSTPKEKKESSLDPDGAQSKDAVRADYVNIEPNQGCLASGHLVERKDNVAEREDLWESQSDLSMGLKADDGRARSREVSLPIQATPKHGFVTKQAHFLSSSVDTVKSDAIVIQPSGSQSPQSYQSQESLRQTGRNRYPRRDLNQTHRDSKPRSRERPPQMSYSPVGTGSEIPGQHMGVAPRDNRAALQSSISQNPQNQFQNSALQMHPVVQTSNSYPQTQILGQHMIVSPPDSQNPQNQYQNSFAYPQTQIPQNPVQSNYQQESQMQSHEAYNQMWQQYYYNYYYYQQQQQLMSEQPQPNQNPQPQLDQNLLQLLSKQYQSQANTQYPQPQQVKEQLNTQQQSQEPQNQQQIQFQQQQQEWFQQQQWQQQQYFLYLQQQQLQGEAKGDEQRLSMPQPQVSTTNSDVQKVCFKNQT